jgi:predicted nucleic acid-binding protein
MNGIDFFVDTNVLVAILRGNPVALNMAKYLFIYGISIITEIELRGKKGITPSELYDIRILLKDCIIIDLSQDIKEIAISLKQKYTLKTPDAIIAATAKKYNLPLVTADADFKKLEVEGIAIVLLKFT